MLLRKHIDDLMEQRRLPLHMVMETSSGQSACQLAALGVGVALADPVLAANVPGIVLRDFEPKLTLPYGFLLPNAYAPSEQAREFARIFVRLVKETAPQRVELGECSLDGNAIALKRAPKRGPVRRSPVSSNNTRLARDGSGGAAVHGLCRRFPWHFRYIRLSHGNPLTPAQA